MIEEDSRKKIVDRLERYCAYQERCHQEVRSKLLSLKVYGNDLEEVILHLMEEGFLNEERYAKSYARGKFRINKWGKIKIEQYLKRKNISRYCIKKALQEIDEEEYADALAEIVDKEVKKLSPPINKIKLTKRIMAKGFEYPLILESLKGV